MIIMKISNTILSVITLMLLSLPYISQNDIRISDSLLLNAEAIPLKLGNMDRRNNKKFQYGEYALVSHNKQLPKATNRQNLLGTKREINFNQKFSYLMINSENDSATIAAAHTRKSKTEKNMVLGVIDFGEYELVKSDYFTAWISINHQQDESWTLLMGSTSGTEAEHTSESFLTNGKRNIQVVPVTGIRSGVNFLGVPALGLEFIEDGKSLCALQTFSGKLSHEPNTVWIDKRLDPQTKLILASAMMVIAHHNQYTSEF